ncbi:MAG: response regulator [Desulfuromonadales bacterium]|nr:response regulator [Desulfuromonadales bacterium]
MLIPETLGQLLLMQSIVISLPDEKSIFSFVCRGLLDIPGVSEVCYANAAREQSDEAVFRFPLFLGETYRGELLFTVKDAEAFVPYEDCLKNFCYMLAVILEERSQRAKNEVFQAELEERIQERTSQLEKEILERIKSEQAAKTSEKLFKELFQNVADPIYISDTSGKIIAANNQACQELGYTLGEMLQLHVTDIDTKSGASDLLIKNLQLLEQSSSTTFEANHRRKDGSIFPVELNVCTIDFSGQKAVMGVARNISKRKRTEDCLTFLAQTTTIRSEEDFFHRLARYLADSLDMDFIRIDTLEPGNLSARTVAVFFDGEFVDNISYTLKDTPCGEVVDKNVCCYTDGVRQRFPRDAVHQDMNAESYVGTILWGSNGKQIGLIAAMSRKPLANQEIAQAILQMVSVRAAAELERNMHEEERLRLEQQLLHTQKLESLGVLAGGIAHDFNNILTSIIGNAELAMMRMKPESTGIDNLQRIQQAAIRAADLAKQMLAYSGKGKFVLENLDFNSLLEEMLHMLEVSISKKAVLRLNITPNLPTVQSDPTQMRQIVMNLVINASEAIGEKSGVIAISTGCMDCDKSYLRNVWLDENLKEGLYVFVEVADTGCGMDDKTQAKIFDPFFTTKFTGRGLGMAAVLGIVNSHKGAIRVYSELGKGTTFKILLPASNRPVEVFNHNHHTDHWKGEGKVLLVDDEESIRGIGKERLKEFGFTTITANDGREAIEIFRQHPDIAFVILDLTMPHMDGEQCFRELRRLKPDVKVIMSSGFSEHEVTQKFVGKGLSGFIQKPYKLSVLKEAIQKI